MTEAELQREVLRMAEDRGILAFHVFDSRATLGSGFPDLVLCGERRTIFVELKNDHNNLQPDQKEWMHRLRRTGQHFEVWRPADLRDGFIESVLDTL